MSQPSTTRIFAHNVQEITQPPNEAQSALGLVTGLTVLYTPVVQEAVQNGIYVVGVVGEQEEEEEEED
jgi:hypothetical protein